MAKPKVLEGTGEELEPQLKQYPKQRFRLVPLEPEIDNAPVQEPDPTLALFAQWDKEDAAMTPEEIAEENRTWEEFKANLNAERDRAGARRVF